MIEQQLTLSDLPVSSSEIYEMMGYGNQTVPEPEIEAETQKLLKQISAIARPSFLFFSISVFEFLYRQVFFSRLFSTKFFYGIKKGTNPTQISQKKYLCTVNACLLSNTL